MPPHPQRVVAATVVLRSRCPSPVLTRRVRALASQSPHERTHVDITQFRRLYGALPADIDQVCRFARQAGLKVVGPSAERLAVDVSGTLDELARAFGVAFIEVDSGDPTIGVYLSHRGPIRVPATLDKIVVAVLGLDGRSVSGSPAARAARGATPPVDPRSVERAYRLPAATGKGQTIGIIALGGGINRRDLDRYFRLRRLAPPSITTVSINGQANRPAHPDDVRRLTAFFTPGARVAPPPTGALTSRDVTRLRDTKWTIEATMDVSLIGTFANGARIAVYFAPDDVRGKYSALTHALTDRRRQPAVISCSYGIDEAQLPRSVAAVMSRAYAMAALRGVSVCSASGDAPGEVQFPASSPHVLACGGTHLPPGGGRESPWAEVVGGQVMASSGGFSRHFARPGWQRQALATYRSQPRGRGVPDVSAKADMAGGYGIVVGGTLVAMGGTSAAAPLWAALIARLNERLGCQVGWLGPLLYRSSVRSALRRVASRPGTSRGTHDWHPTTGLGTPDGEALLGALSTRP